MAKYRVSVVRIGYACHDIVVEAASKTEAEDLAVDKAGDFEFTEHASDYKADGCQEVEDGAAS